MGLTHYDIFHGLNLLRARLIITIIIISIFLFLRCKGCFVSHTLTSLQWRYSLHVSKETHQPLVKWWFSIFTAHWHHPEDFKNTDNRLLIYLVRDAAWVHAFRLSHFSYVWLFATPWTIAHQAPLSMGFSRQEYWSGLACPPPGDLPDPGIKPTSLPSPALAGSFFTTNTTWEARSLRMWAFFKFPRWF